MKKVRVFPKLVPHENKQEANHPNLFLFCESSSGTAQFRATGGGDLECTVERIAGLLAMQCLVRGQDPAEFQVLVPAEQSLVARLISRTEELLRGARDRLPNVFERPAERSVGRGSEQPCEQGNRVAAEYHGAYSEIPCVFVTEQIRGGDARGVGA